MLPHPLSYQVECHHQHVQAKCPFPVEVLLALSLYHVIESGYYLNREWKLGLLLLVVAFILVAYGVRQHGAVAGGLDRARNSARYSHLISYGALLLALALVAALAAIPALLGDAA